MIKSITTLEIKWGIIFSLFSLLWIFFERAMGWHDILIDKQAIMTNLFAIPSVAIYVYAILEKRKRQLQDVITWRQGFLCGLLVALVVAILSPLVQYLSYSVISPDFFTNMIHYSVVTLGKNRESMEAYYNLKSYIIQGVTGALASGILISAVAALFLKKEPAVSTSVK